MNEFEESLKIVAAGMISVAKGIDELADKIRRLSLSGEVESGESVVPSPIVVRRQPGRKPATERKGSAKSTVLDLIGRKSKGINIYELKQETGFNDKKIYNLIFLLKREGKIRSLRRGVFVKS